MSLLLGLSLLLAPVEAAPAAVSGWSAAGGRAWTVCREFERQAEALLLRASQRDDESPGETPWAQRAHDCPGAPAVLVVAALRELRKVPAYPPLAELQAALPRLDAAQRRARVQAQAWLAQAQVEAQRRGEPAPLLTHWFVAQAALGLGDPVTAAEALAQAEARGEVESWRAEQAGAVAALLAGDLQRALELGYRARALAPGGERQTAVFVLALIYDRAGAPEAAARELAGLGAGRFGFSRGAIDTLLPLPERLYLGALEEQALRNPGNASLLWRAYLACPEPEAPERRLARQRLEALRPRGSVVPSAGAGGQYHLMILSPSGPQLQL